MSGDFLAKFDLYFVLNLTLYYHDFHFLANHMREDLVLVHVHHALTGSDLPHCLSHANTMGLLTLSVSGKEKVSAKLFIQVSQ